MAEVFADSAGWACAFVQTERFHAPAAAFLRRWQADATRVVTTNYVFAELVALLTSPLRVPCPQQIIILNATRRAAWVDVVHVDAAMEAAAYALFAARPDKLWSLADCVSFVVMQQRGVSEALTTDHHFEQAGYARLLK